MKQNKKWSQIVVKAWTDPQFKKELLTHPDKVLKENGINTQGRRVKIRENNEQELNFILPIQPEGLSAEELKKIAAAGGPISLFES